MSYGRVYQCPDVVLLYPHHGGLSPHPARQQYSIARPGPQDSLFVAALDVSLRHALYLTVRQKRQRRCPVERRPQRHQPDLGRVAICGGHYRQNRKGLSWIGSDRSHVLRGERCSSRYGSVFDSLHAL